MTNSAETVARGVLSAINAGDWAGAAAHVHLDEARAWVDGWVRVTQDEHLEGCFAGVGSRGELSELPPLEAVARYFEAHDGQGRLPRKRRDLRGIVGCLAEDDATTHCTYRHMHILSNESEMEVLTLRLDAGRWHVRVTGELFRQVMVFHGDYHPDES